MNCDPKIDSMYTDMEISLYNGEITAHIITDCPKRLAELLAGFSGASVVVKETTRGMTKRYIVKIDTISLPLTKEEQQCTNELE